MVLKEIFKKFCAETKYDISYIFLLAECGQAVCNVLSNPSLTKKLSAKFSKCLGNVSKAFLLFY